MNIKQNFKKTTNKDSLMEYGQGALAAGWYAAIPTLLKLEGWLAWAVGCLVPAAAGMALGMKGLVNGAVTMGVGHLIYEFGDEALGGIWSLNDNSGMSDYPQMYAPQYDRNGVASLPAMSDFLMPGDDLGLRDHLFPNDVVDLSVSPYNTSNDRIF